MDPAVYWRRRAAVLGGLALLVGAPTAWAVAGGEENADGARESASSAGGAGEAEERAGTGGGAGRDPSTAPTGTPSATADPSATATAVGKAADEQAAGAEAADLDPADAPVCPADVVGVRTEVGSSSNPEGGDVLLRLVIANTGAQACALDVGSAPLELQITSGSDRIWSSDDCQEEAESRLQVLQPDEEVASEVAWAQERSAPGCPDGLPDPRPGTYSLTGRVGEVTSTGASFEISG